MLLLDVVLPLAAYYALRALGAGPWTALVAGSVIPAVRIVSSLVLTRRVELVAVFAVSLLLIGTTVGLVTEDPRLLMARESYLTAVVGLWILATLRFAKPLVFTATAGFMPDDQLAQWNQAWVDEPRFRTTMRLMTLAFGLAFLIDAAARVVMAYTLPLDLVPAMGALFLVVMLSGVVAAGRWFGSRRVSSPVARPSRSD